MTEQEDKLIIACRVMKPELDHILTGVRQVRVCYLDQGLHRTPQKITRLIQEQIDLLASRHTTIVLGYGLCSNGIVGVQARQRQLLVVPRCHDCLGFFLGSPAVYRDLFENRPGTYYLTPGWIDEKKDPLGIVQEEYAPRLGNETAVWAMNEELKHYTHIALILNGASEAANLRQRARQNAEYFNKIYEEVSGSMAYFEKLVFGPYEPSEFFQIPAGREIDSSLFYDHELE